MLPTVREVLEPPVLAAGDPHVLSGADRLDHEVRWAHVAEIAEIGGLLRGDELVLTTGVALPRSDAGLEAFVTTLAEVPVAGLVVEPGARVHRTAPGRHGARGGGGRAAAGRACGAASRSSR
ncbi:hypothetical protein GCM10025868_08230 [Angustibacter aerolatus]|uniref:Purine catabolism PurC-like domain-containing protein n=1 Tax=Angustibacter aerolatus TaxID=1162965 RepID=A0ABQ6JBM1_9ACTN|nr:PucR family transcriptional regulator ligand-binding domain-containing protein [Angustibacter aerolatus]GMA85573.1 hypothetical protein GCM10025868_08230 [Angustibacter aerolatus]